MNNLKSYIKQRDRKNHGFSELVRQEKAKLVSLIKDKKEMVKRRVLTKVRKSLK